MNLLLPSPVRRPLFCLAAALCVAAAALPPSTRGAEPAPADTAKPTAASPPLAASALARTVVEHPEWQALFDAQGVTGTTVVYDLRADCLHFYNPARAARRFTPASTFKIPNSLIALDTGVVHNERTQVFRWDGQQRAIPEWNRDHTLRTAIKYSVVWVYQEIARQVGAARMQGYLDRFDYGNRDTSGGVDQFWLGSTLEISALEQVAFLKKLYLYQLPVSERATRVVEDILLTEATDTYVLRAKTGSSPDKHVGWWVGWVETDDNTFFFATNIDATAATPKRQGVTRDVLRALHILPK